MYGGAFGGDHNSVCIDGCSAGSVNGWFHLTNPASWPYFHRIVLTGIGAGGIAEYEGPATDNMYDMVLAEAGKSDLAGLRSLTTSKIVNKMVAAQDKWLQQNLAANQAGKPTNAMPENLEFYAPRQGSDSPKIFLFFSGLVVFLVAAPKTFCGLVVLVVHNLDN